MPTVLLCLYDHLDGLAIHKTALERCGFRVLVSADTSSCLQVLREQEVNILVIDYCAPLIDGVAVVEAIRQSHPELPIVMFSATPVAPDVRPNVDRFFTDAMENRAVAAAVCALVFPFPPRKPVQPVQDWTPAISKLR